MFESGHKSPKVHRRSPPGTEHADILSLLPHRDELAAQLQWCGVELNQSVDETMDELSILLTELSVIGMPEIAVAVPWLMDLASLIRHVHPNLRASRKDIPGFDCRDAYVREWLIPFANLPSVRFLSQKYQAAGAGRLRMTALFVRCIVIWWSEQLRDESRASWLSYGREPISGELLGDFYQAVVSTSATARNLDKAIDQLEQFLIGVMSILPTAYQSANRQLIKWCRESQNLEEEELRPRAVVPVGGDWFDLCRRPGEYVGIQQVRRDTGIRMIHEALPQELALLKHHEQGQRRFLEKAVHEGILINERQNFTDHERTRRVLLCITAAVGETVNTNRTAFYLNRRLRGSSYKRDATFQSDSAASTGSSTDMRTRALLFDILLDVARLVHDPDLHVDIRVFLECPDEPGRNLSWGAPLAELRQWLLGDRFEFMIELESRLPGFFLERSLSSDMRQVASREFIGHLELGASGYDNLVYVFLGSKRSLTQIVPHDVVVPRRGTTFGCSSVRLIRVDERPLHVGMSTGNSRESSWDWNMESVPDVDCRRSIVAATFGAGDENKIYRKSF